MREKINQKLLELSLIKRQLVDEKAHLVQAEDSATWAEIAQKTAQSAAAEVQSLAHARISSVVSRCLAAVFDDPYQFGIIFEEKRGKTEAKIVFERQDLVVDPLSASGGGVVDVAAFALRLACLSLRRPQLNKVIFLDEPFRFVFRENLPRVQSLLVELSEELGFQFIMVTHLKELVAGNIINSKEGND